MSEEEITYKLNEMLDFARLSTDIGFIDQTEQIKVLESTLDLIDKLQKENENYKKLILDIKEKLNNIQFEVEQAWRKIEKLEDKNE